MARRRSKSVDEWLAEREARDPNFSRDTARMLARRPPLRKVPLLCDESLEDELVADLRTVRLFKVLTLPTGRGDDFVWAQARQRGLVLLSADEDFYDDRRYPLRESPGAIILRGEGAGERTVALARLSALWDLQGNYARFGRGMFIESKTRATPTHIFHRFLDERGAVVEIEW